MHAITSEGLTSTNSWVKLCHCSLLHLVTFLFPYKTKWRRQLWKMYVDKSHNFKRCLWRSCFKFRFPHRPPYINFSIGKSRLLHSKKPGHDANWSLTFKDMSILKCMILSSTYYCRKAFVAQDQSNIPYNTQIWTWREGFTVLYMSMNPNTFLPLFGMTKACLI